MQQIKGQMECMRILFSAGVNHYIRNNHGNTPVEVFRSMYPYETANIARILI